MGSDLGSLKYIYRYVERKPDHNWYLVVLNILKRMAEIDHNSDDNFQDDYGQLWDAICDEITSEDN